MSIRARQLVVVVAALAVAGCGSDDEPEGAGLPRAAVSELERRLDEIERRFTDARDNDNPGACDDIARDSFPAVEAILARLPNDVDPELRRATEQSFERLRQLTSEGCADVEPPQTETTPPETEPEPPPPPPPPPRTETTPPETDTAPPDEGDDEGDGNGNGQGNGGGNGNGNGPPGGTPPGQGGGGGAPAPPAGGRN